MNNYKVEFKLKQHTPIIHFQSDQIGATLRATELKPKFDRFLLQNVPDLPYKKNANGHKSLEYKVTIEPDLSNSTEIDKRQSLFFGNMGDGEEKRYKHNPQKLKITFFTFTPKVKEAIEKHFEAFLANTNFGTRQSKGYGGFYLTDKKFDATLIPYTVYSFRSDNWEKDIKILYSFLRQGINLPRPSNPFYTKPLIFAYAKSKGIVWDKKAIKEHYFKNKLQEQQQKHPQSDALHYNAKEKKLLRDLFGLSSSQEWRSYQKTITKENSKIERFKSPLTFKIVDNHVYFWANDSVKEILGKTFSIKQNNQGDLKLSTPNEFDFDDFFKFALNVDISKHIESNYHSCSEYALLKKIFQDIKADK